MSFLIFHPEILFLICLLRPYTNIKSCNNLFLILLFSFESYCTILAVLSDIVKLRKTVLQGGDEQSPKDGGTQ